MYKPIQFAWSNLVHSDPDTRDRRDLHAAVGGDQSRHKTQTCEYLLVQKTSNEGAFYHLEGCRRCKGKC